MVMQRIANPLNLVRFQDVPFYICPGGEIGKHKGLKIPRSRGFAGSSPALGIIFFYIKNKKKLYFLNISSILLNIDKYILITKFNYFLLIIFFKNNDIITIKINLYL